MSVTQYIHTHPFAALIIAGSNLLFAESLPYIDGLHVPEIVMQCVQLLAWGSAIAVSVVTLYGKFRKK